MSHLTTKFAGPSDREAVAETFDALVNDYNQRIEASLGFAGMEHRFFVDGKARLIRELVAAHLPDPSKARALDLGCGIGNYDGDLGAFFGSLQGADVSAESIEYAKHQHSNVEYNHYDGNELPFSGDWFDVVFAICVMHHVPPNDWNGFVREMKRVLKPGGLALIFEHNPLNPATQYVVRGCDIDRDAVLLWPTKLKSIFRQAGFAGSKTRTIFSVPPAGRALQIADRVLGFLPFGAQYYLSAVKPYAGEEGRS